MQFPFKKHTKSLIGMDISSTSVKLLELSKQPGNRYRVESYAVAPFPPNAIVEKSIKDQEEVTEAVKLALERANSHTKNVALAVATASVITKTLQLDASLTEEELEMQIEVEADRYIPYPIDEVNIDFEVMGIAENNSDLVDVLVVASRCENVNERTDVVERAGMQVNIVDVESYAMQRTCSLVTEQLPEGPDGQTIAVVDIGATMLSLNVLHNHETVYTREEVFGGKLLTEEIQQRYGLSYAQAGYAKKHGDLPDDYVPEVLIPFKESLVQQIRRSLQLFYSANQYGEVSAIVLAGGTACLPGLVAFIEKNLGVPTSIVNPFADMSIAPRVNAAALSNDAPALMLSCGLAMREMQF